MASVAWNWSLLTTTNVSGGSHRAARRGPSAVSSPSDAINSSGTDPAIGSPPSWTPSSDSKPKAVLHDSTGQTYVFAFWSIMAGTTGGNAVGNSIEPYPDGFIVPVGADGNARATAFYTWDFGTGNGPNGIFIDAMDRDAGFFPDDFVDVSPEDGRAHDDPNSLYWKANDGYLNSDTDFTVNEKITAFNPPGRQFFNWIEVKSLTYPSPGGPDINGKDVLVMPGSRLVAFAVYTAAPPQPEPPIDCEHLRAVILQEDAVLMSLTSAYINGGGGSLSPQGQLLGPNTQLRQSIDAMTFVRDQHVAEYLAGGCRFPLIIPKHRAYKIPHP